MSLPLDAGQSYVTYDGGRDAIWILNWPFRSAYGRFNQGTATLLRFDPQSRDHQTYLIDGLTDGLAIAAGITVDSEGMVWSAWGRRLIRLDPGSGDIREWVIPQPDAADVAIRDPILGGIAVDVAAEIGGRDIWVALNYTTAVQLFDPVTEAWSTLDTASLMAVERSKFAWTSPNTLVLNGVTRGDPAYSEVPGGGSTMASIDTAARKTEPMNVRALAYSSRQDGTIDYVDGDTGAVTKLAANASAEPTSSEIPAGQLDPVRDVMAGDGAGTSWLWRTAGPTSIDVLRLQPDARTFSAYSFPLKISKWNGTGGSPIFPLGVDPAEFIGREIAASPEIKGLVADKRGDAWLVLGSSAYPPLYRLHIEQP